MPIANRGGLTRLGKTISTSNVAGSWILLEVGVDIEGKLFQSLDLPPEIRKMGYKNLFQDSRLQIDISTLRITSLGNRRYMSKLRPVDVSHMSKSGKARSAPRFLSHKLESRVYITQSPRLSWEELEVRQVLHIEGIVNSGTG